MSKVLEVKVTKTDIRNGARGSPYSCPIALATKRAIQDNQINVYCLEVNATELTVQGIDSGNRYVIGLNNACKKFVKAFDGKGGRKIVKPIAFKLSLKDLRIEEQHIRSVQGGEASCLTVSQTSSM